MRSCSAMGATWRFIRVSFLIAAAGITAVLYRPSQRSELTSIDRLLWRSIHPRRTMALSEMHRVAGESSSEREALVP